MRDGDCVVIVPTRLAANGSKVLALPKGHPEEGESPGEAALREVREEAGVVARLVAQADGRGLAPPLELVAEERRVEVEDLHLAGAPY